MAVKNGTLTLKLTSGKETGISGYIDWYTELISDNIYRMYIDFQGYADVTGVSGGRTCWYQFWVNDNIMVDSNISFTSSSYKSIYTTSFEIEVNDDGTWDGWFGGLFGFNSNTYGKYEVSADLTAGTVAGKANYKVYYYTGYGSNSLYKTQSGFDMGDTCNVIDDSLTRTGISEDFTFTITGDRNGGDVNSIATATKTIITSYIFKGWSKTSGDSTAAYTTTSTFTVSGNTSLYAVWAINKSTTYSNNTIGDLEPSSPTRASIGSIFNLTLIPNNGQESAKIEAGCATSYEFKGWASSPTSKIVLDSNKQYTSDTTVYAIWECLTNDKNTVSLPTPSRDEQLIDEYTVILDPGEGSVNPTSETVSKTKSYEFNGWSTIQDNKSYIVSNPYTPTNETDHNLYAIWTEVESTGCVSLPTPTYPSFKFIGWSINANSTNYVDMTFTPTQDITLYAIYKASYSGEPYIWHNNKWHRVVPHLRYEDVFNSCINSI